MISREHPEAGLSGTDYAPNADGIFVPDVPIEHRDEEYDPRGFDVLWEMQVRHFCSMRQNAHCAISVRRGLLWT
jgi:hypothetical protein